MQFSLFLLVLTVLARLLALNLTFKVLNMEVLLNLSFILLTLQLGHLLSVILLLTRKVILELFVLLGRCVDFLSQLTLLLFKSLILSQLLALLVDVFREVGISKFAHHFLNHILRGLDELSFVLPDFSLIMLNCRLLLQLTAQLFSAVLKLLGDTLHTEISVTNECNSN